MPSCAALVAISTDSAIMLNVMKFLVVVGWRTLYKGPFFSSDMLMHNHTVPAWCGDEREVKL